MQAVSPFIRTPFTDITAGLVSHQFIGTTCGEMELHMMECVEHYGIEMGAKKCKCFIADFYECQTKTMQYARFYEIRAERDRQIRRGKLTGCDKYMSPKLDSY